MRPSIQEHASELPSGNPNDQNGAGGSMGVPRLCGRMRQVRYNILFQLVPLAGLPRPRIAKGLACQTCLRGSRDPQRLFGVVANHSPSPLEANRSIQQALPSTLDLSPDRSVSLPFRKRIRYLFTLRTSPPRWRTP